ncbi:hypothetical protein ATANTOWER_000541, partial [Ataeniobius toweri]|nr:hypothetical protein [Ataeniobius toweri]
GGCPGGGGTSTPVPSLLQPLTGLHVGAVHVSVEEDDGKSEDEDGVRVPELSHYTRVADAVALARMVEPVSCINSPDQLWLNGPLQLHQEHGFPELVRDIRLSPTSYRCFLPVRLYQPLNLLCLSLHSDMCLEFSKPFIQLHPREVHFIYHTTGKKRHR